MKKGIVAVSVLALVSLVGCSSRTPENLETTASAWISVPPMFPGQAGIVSTSNPQKQKVGDPFRLFGVMQLRSCNPDKTECKIGAAKLQSRVTLVALDKANATVKVDYQLDIGKTQTAAGTTVKIPDDVPTLRDSSTDSKIVTVDYNRIGRIDLRYGVAIKLCVEAPDGTQSISVSSCQDQEVVLLRQPQ